MDKKWTEIKQKGQKVEKLGKKQQKWTKRQKVDKLKTCPAKVDKRWTKSVRILFTFCPDKRWTKSIQIKNKTSKSGQKVDKKWTKSGQIKNKPRKSGQKLDMSLELWWIWVARGAFWSFAPHFGAQFCWVQLGAPPKWGADRQADIET